MIFHSIGTKTKTATEIFRQHGITPLRQILTPTLFTSISPKVPPPKTILIPEVVFWLMASVALCGSSMTGCISNFWASLRAMHPDLPTLPVTEEAFCTARGRLQLRFFLRLFHKVTFNFLCNYNQRWQWHGHRLLGIDGTEVALPREGGNVLRERFPPPSNKQRDRACPQARLVGLVGLFDGLCYAFRWTNLKVGEQACALRLMRFLEPLDLLLADRNFPGLPTFAAVLAHKADFLFRLPAKRYAKYKRQPTSSRRVQEWYLQLPLSSVLRRQYPQLPKLLRVRVLEYQRPGFRVSWLITSLLDTDVYPYQEVVSLYHQRWRQETCHREWKHTLQLNDLRSYTADGLLKEVLVQLTLNNVLRWVQAQATPPDCRPVDLKFLETKRLVLANVPVMTVAPIGILTQLYLELPELIGRERIRIRPNRSYSRPWDTRIRNKGNGKVALPARLTTKIIQMEAPI